MIQRSLTRSLVIAASCLACSEPTPPSPSPSHRASEAEAKTQLEKIYDSASSYFKSEHAERGTTAFIGPGGRVEDMAPHRCPSQAGSPSAGSAGITPPLDVDCNSGPDRSCVPTTNPNGEKGQYDIALWNDNPVWNGLNFLQEAPHRFHYNFIYSNNLAGYGACQFTVQAFGDLDGDGLFSTYEKYGAGDIQGVNSAIGLYIDNAGE